MESITKNRQPVEVASRAPALRHRALGRRGDGSDHPRPLLIYGLDMGVRGAALGTVGGQTVSAAMSLWFFFGQRRRPYRISARDLRPHGPTIRALLGIGAPSFLAGLGAPLLVVLVNNALAATATALAAHAVCGRIQTFATMPQMGISQGLQPIVGHNAGRRLADRVRRARTLALRATVGYGVLAAIAIVILADQFAGIFVEEPAVADATANALRIIAIGIAAAGVAPLASAYFQFPAQPGDLRLLRAGPPDLLPSRFALQQPGVPSPAPLRHQRRVQALPPQERSTLTGRDGLLVAGEEFQLLPRGEVPAGPRPARTRTLLTTHDPILGHDHVNSSSQRFSILNSPCPEDLL